MYILTPLTVGAIYSLFSSSLSLCSYSIVGLHGQSLGKPGRESV